MWGALPLQELTALWPPAGGAAFSTVPCTQQITNQCSLSDIPGYVPCVWVLEFPPMMLLAEAAFPQRVPLRESGLHPKQSSQNNLSRNVLARLHLQQVRRRPAC